MMALIGFTVVLIASAAALAVSIVMFIAMAGYGGSRREKLIAVGLFVLSALGFYLALSNAPFPICINYGG